MKKVIRGWKDCVDSRNVETFARQNGVEIRTGKGDHKVMRRNGQSETYYTGRELSVGVARAVWKFFLRVGLICLLGYVLIGMLGV